MAQAHSIVAEICFFLCHRFGECIGRVFCSLAILNRYCLHFDLVTRVVISHIDVLATCAVCVSLAEFYAALIVHENVNFGLMIFQFTNEFAVPQNLLDTVGE